MAKHHKKHHPIRHRLTPEQKAKRRARFNKMLKTLMWLNPATQIHMVAKSIQDRINKRRIAHGKKPLNNPAERILLGIQRSVAAAMAKRAGTKISADLISGAEDPIAKVSELIAQNETANGQVQNIDSVSDSLAEVPTSEDGADVSVSEEVSNADGGSADDMQLIFAKAKSEANKLTGKDKEEAMKAIAELEHDFKSNVAIAKKSVANADKKDVAQAKTALGKTSVHAVAATVSDATAEHVEKADSDEKKALGIEESFFEKNKTMILIGASVTVVAIGAYLYINSKKGK